MKLTDKDFWNNFWDNIGLPNRISNDLKLDRAISETIKNYIPKVNFNKKVLEIGCAVGKWLVFFYEELNYTIHGIEYLESGVKKTIENFEKCQISSKSYKVFHEDFSISRIDEKYDIVMSLGFIEHFKNPISLLDKHLFILREDGFLIIGVPNFTGINKYLQKNVDKYLEPQEKILSTHNLTTMKKEFFIEYAKNRELDLVFMSYIGGFEPTLFNFNPIKKKIWRIIMVVLTTIISKLFRESKNSKFSGYLFIIMKNKVH